MLPANSQASFDSQLQLSVLIIAYNIERFIAEALDSVLMQEVNFDYEILIGEDCSTDRTRALITEYGKKYPDKIRLILHERNLGAKKNYVQTLQACKGKYIALLDGDDYWTSPHKLQKQADFLDRHPECSICFHNVNVVYEDGSVAPHPFHMQEPKHYHSRPIPKTISTLEDLVRGNYIQTCSVMFRAGLFDEIPNWYYNFPTGDWPLHLLNAEHGYICYLGEILSVYRVHRGGIWSMSMSEYRTIDDVENMINAYDIINRYFNYRYKKIVRQSVIPLYYKAAHILYGTGRYREASYYAQKCLFSLPLQPQHRQKFLLKVMLKTYLPQASGFLEFLKSTFLK